MRHGQPTKPTRSRAPRVSRRALLKWTAVNLAFVILLAFVENVIAERHWLSTLSAYMPQAPFAIPSALLLMLAILRRERGLVAANVPAGLVVLFCLLGFHVPLHSAAPPSARKIRVMTLNLHQGSHGIFKIADLFDKYRPDVVCVQEASGGGKWGDPVWQIEQLRPKEWQVVRNGEIAILSRHPIRRKREKFLPMGTQRAILAAEVSVGGSRVTVCTTHFNTAVPGTSIGHRKSSLSQYLRQAAMVRLAQTHALLDFARKLDGPVILTGDLNTPPRGRWYRRVSSEYRDAFAAAGWGFGYTYRSRLPLIRLDYVFARKPSRVVACFVPSDVASDHRAVVADVDFAL
jgi:vancomycin resistance protein VanJ